MATSASTAFHLTGNLEWAGRNRLDGHQNSMAKCVPSQSCGLICCVSHLMSSRRLTTIQPTCSGLARVQLRLDCLPACLLACKSRARGCRVHIDAVRIAATTINITPDKARLATITVQ